MAIIPAYLIKGDTILIIATARARNLEAIRPAITILESWGLNVELGENIFKTHHQFAGTDEERAKDLQWALQHKKAKAILIAGGGYGTMRIMDVVNFKPLLKYPKWLIGYSDSTILHNRFCQLKISSIHGTMAFQFTKNHTATDSIKQMLFGKKINYTIPTSSLNRLGYAEGEIVGGNLSLLYATSGSVDNISTKNKILFIEDIDEQLYHLDRMMLQLKRSNNLSQLKGLIVGGMSDMKDNKIPFGKNYNEIILDAVKEYHYPVCFNFPAGHVDQNMAIYFNKKAKLNVTKQKVSLNYF